MAMSTTVWSTTRTQPITFDRIAPGLIQVTIWDGSTQVYWAADIHKACKHESSQEH